MGQSLTVFDILHEDVGSKTGGQRICVRSQEVRKHGFQGFPGLAGRATRVTTGTSATAS